jgi:NAD(P)-dependent dehydrogenase (short-subunit alcohol dehydrogenase family)
MLEDKGELVMGPSRSIDVAIARALAEVGGNVMLNDCRKLEAI